MAERCVLWFPLFFNTQLYADSSRSYHCVDELWAVQINYFKEKQQITKHTHHTIWHFRANALPAEKGVLMAYMCVLAPSQECDGCQECEEQKQEYDNSDFERDYERDEAYISYLEREGY